MIHQIRRKNEVKRKYYINGLNCSTCAKNLEEKLNKIKEIKKVQVNFLKKTLEIEFQENFTKNEQEIKQLINRIEPNINLEEIEIEKKLINIKKINQILLALLFFIFALLCSNKVNIIKISLYLISYGIIGFEIIIKALKKILKRDFFDENFLMTLATIGAITIGEYPEAVAVMLFYQIGELFQDYAIEKSKKSIKSLVEIKPDYANVKENKRIIKKLPEEVQIDDIIIVQPGEKVPLDGKIIEGTSFLDTHAITGESVPKKVTKGDTIFNGCINQTGILTIKVTCEYKESTVSKILNLIENANEKKATSEKFITKFSKIYTPIVVLFAICIAIFPPLLIKDTNFQIWLYRSLSFLVISCPCALVISVPLSFFAGIGSCAKKGILIKGSQHLETFHQIKTFVFDKTGTLTEGIFEVQEIQPIHISKEELIELVAHAEYHSNHPIAKSIKEIYPKVINPEQIKNLKELSGRGIKAIVNKKNIIIGNEELMKEENISYEPINKIGTVLYIAIEKEYKGYIIIADKIKKHAKETFQKLKQMQFKNLIMLTGDTEKIAKKIADELSIDHYYAELLPQEKSKKLNEIRAKLSSNEKVAFLGDGINDAPVLALADVGIAMGGVGSDAAIESADIVFMTDELSKIIETKTIVDKTLTIVKQNIIFSIFIKIVILCLSALGITTMWIAVFADVGVSLLAILNAFRLLKK